MSLLAERSSTVAAADADREPSLVRRIVGNQQFILLVAFIVLFAFFTERNSVFLSVSEIGNNVTEFCTLIMLAVGETFVIATGGIDLSVASTAEFAGIVAAFGMEHSASHGQAFIIALGTVIALFTGAFVGLVNALLINVLKLVPFVATLVTLGAGAGMCLVLTGGSPVDNDINAIDMTRPLLGPFSWPAMIIIGITIISGLYLHLSRFGRYTFAIGSNPFAARAVGINVTLHTYLVYILSGILAGLTGMYLFMQLGSGSPTSADGAELTAIAAVVIGGARLTGGSARLTGTVLGAAILTIVSSGLIIMNVSPNFNQVAVAICIALAASLQVLRRGTRKEA